MINFYIGTLFNGEAELEEHTKAINSQVGVNFTHHVIRNLTEHKAHQQLFKDWKLNSKNFDLFVKIDADTVLNRQTALFEIGKLFDDPLVTGVQIRLFDYFSNSLIPGMNAFSPKVKFKKRTRKLFPDIADYNHLKVLKINETKLIEPIGFHCLKPNKRQAFYYGYHRMLKNQRSLLKLVAYEWKLTRDDRRLWALFGANSARNSNLPKIFFNSKSIERKFHLQKDFIDFDIEEFIYELSSNG
jgi:hypothetical protein